MTELGDVSVSITKKLEKILQYRNFKRLTFTSVLGIGIGYTYIILTVLC